MKIKWWILLIILFLVLILVRAYFTLRIPFWDNPSHSPSSAPNGSLTSQVESNPLMIYVPPPSSVTLPPLAPLPSEPSFHHFVHPVTPHPKISLTKPEIPKRPKDVNFSPKISKKTVSIKPSKWEIVERYKQIIELDEKYYNIAVESDRYGYKNQAILYYRKYLFVAPSGPHAQEVRSRLAQLESQP
jgi:hypothetical protein